MHKICPQCHKQFGPNDLATARNFERQIYCARACHTVAKRYSLERSLEIMWKHIDRDGPNGCWIWTGGVNNMGYGKMKFGTKIMAVHRLVYQLAHGFIKPRDWCLHKCDTPRCVNPEHIFLGDDSANMADKVAKGRQTRGEDAFKAKLNNAQVMEMRRIRATEGWSYNRLAAHFGLRSGTGARSICLGLHWKHLPVVVLDTGKAP